MDANFFEVPEALWRRRGVFRRIYAELVRYYHKKRGLQLRWTSLDSAMVKAPKGGRHWSEPDGPGQTRGETASAHGRTWRADLGADHRGERPRQVDGRRSLGCDRGPRAPRRPLHLCLDKRYDYADAEAAVRHRRITPQIRRRGEPPLLGSVHGKPRRWVVERTNSWHNRYRGLLVRWERKAENYLAMLHLTCGIIAFQQAHGF